MTTQDTTLQWHDENFLKEVHAWVKQEAEKHSIWITGEFDQTHVYAWSTVIHIPTSAGKIFFKAAANETIFEAALMQWFAEIKTEHMPDLLAVDIKRGWMLMRDGGEQLRGQIRPVKDIKAWHPVVPHFAELQIAAAAHIEKLLEIGVPDYRLEKLPGLLSALLDDQKILLLDQPKGISSAELNQLHEISARFESLCKKLLSQPIPETLNHGDFHDGNVLMKNNHASFIDWGDASVSHPFVTLRTFFVSIEIALDLEDYAFTPEMSALLDDYLKPWTRFASLEELKSIYQLSKPVASVVKTLNWYMTVTPLQGELRAEYEHIVPAVLQEFLYHMGKTEI